MLATSTQRPKNLRIIAAFPRFGKLLRIEWNCGQLQALNYMLLHVSDFGLLPLMPQTPVSYVSAGQYVGRERAAEPEAARLAANPERHDTPVNCQAAGNCVPVARCWPNI